MPPKFPLANRETFAKKFVDWAIDEGYLKEYQDARGRSHTVIQLPRSLQRCPGGLQFHTALRAHHGGFSSLAKLVEHPILLETQSQSEATLQYLMHPAVFRHYFLKWAAKNGYLKEYKDALERSHTVIQLPKALPQCTGGVQFYQVLNVYHGGIQALAQFVEHPIILETRSRSKTTLQNYLKHPVVFRHYFLEWAKEKGYLKEYKDALGRSHTVIQLPRALQRCPGGLQFYRALKAYHRGFLSLAKLVEHPILIETKSKSKVTQYYLADPVVLRHEILELAREEGWLWINERRELEIHLPKSLSTLAQKNPRARKIYSAICSYHS